MIKPGDRVRVTDEVVAWYAYHILEGTKRPSAPHYDAEADASILFWIKSHHLKTPVKGVVTERAGFEPGVYWVKLSNEHGSYEHFFATQDRKDEKKQVVKLRKRCKTCGR